MSLEKLDYISKNIPTLDAQNDLVLFIDWFALSEQVLESIGETGNFKLVSSRLSGALLIYTRSKAIASWEQFKFEVFSFSFPTRKAIPEYINRNVNDITRQVEFHQLSLFSAVPQFHAYVQQLYSILKHERTKTFSTLDPDYSEFARLSAQVAATRAEIYDLRAKNEDDLTEEEEETLLSDPKAAEFWKLYKHELTTFLNQALEFGLCTDGAQLTTPITIGKLAQKIVRNL